MTCATCTGVVLVTPVTEPLKQPLLSLTFSRKTTAVHKGPRSNYVTTNEKLCVAPATGLTENHEFSSASKNPFEYAPNRARLGALSWKALRGASVGACRVRAPFVPVNRSSASEYGNNAKKQNLDQP